MQLTTQEVSWISSKKQRTISIWLLLVRGTTTSTCWCRSSFSGGGTRQQRLARKPYPSKNPSTEVLASLNPAHASLRCRAVFYCIAFLPFFGFSTRTNFHSATAREQVDFSADSRLFKTVFSLLKVAVPQGKNTTLCSVEKLQQKFASKGFLL